MDRREKFVPTVFVPDDPSGHPRRHHTDSSRSPKPPTHLPHFPPARPRLSSWHNVSGSMDYSNIAVVALGVRRNSVKTGKENPFGEEQTTDEQAIDAMIDSRSRHSTGPEVSKRILELSAPTKPHVYIKDLDLVDTKVKLSRLHIQWPTAQTSERKSKSTTRVRASSPETHPQNWNGQNNKQKGERHPKLLCEYVKGLREKRVKDSGKREIRCASEEKPIPKSYFSIGPSEFDLKLVREYNEEQQHLLATVKDAQNWMMAPHSILRNHMQEYAPWAANDVQEEDGLSKVVHFQ